ncbi:MAG TPA: hypothetical protein VMW04_00960 [Patescibacteria group bacterium]|nr:hypothetical protein [Patescibacteria group bacterium]
MNLKLDSLIQTLKNEGQSEEEIDRVLEEITKNATTKLYTEMAAALTEEDLEVINKCSVQEEADFEIKERYSQRTGKSPQSLLEETITTATEEFLAKRVSPR